MAGRSRARRRPPARETVVRRIRPLARRVAWGGSVGTAGGAGGPGRAPPGSAHERVDVVGADADLLVVLLAQADVVMDVEEVHDVAVLVEPDQRSADLEVHLHRLLG